MTNSIIELEPVATRSSVVSQTNSPRTKEMGKLIDASERSIARFRKRTRLLGGHFLNPAEFD
jgi:hypothetical protein